MHVINHEWNRSMFVASAMCFVWDTKLDLPIYNTSRNKSSSLVLKPCKSVQETSEEVLIH